MFLREIVKACTFNHQLAEMEEKESLINAMLVKNWKIPFLILLVVSLCVELFGSTW